MTQITSVSHLMRVMGWPDPTERFADYGSTTTLLPKFTEIR